MNAAKFSENNFARGGGWGSAHPGENFLGFYLQQLNLISILGKFAQPQAWGSKIGKKFSVFSTPFFVRHFSCAVFHTPFLIILGNIFYLVKKPYQCGILQLFHLYIHFHHRKLRFYSFGSWLNIGLPKPLLFVHPKLAD